MVFRVHSEVGPLKFYLFIYFWLYCGFVAVCKQAFSGCVEKGYSLLVVHGLLIVVASLVTEHGHLGEWAQ